MTIISKSRVRQNTWQFVGKAYAFQSYTNVVNEVADIGECTV